MSTLLAAARATIRAVIHADIKIIDPIWRHAKIARIQGYVVWDTRFPTDANLKI
jgi:peptide/nickel transport system substrate-binding protein